MKSNIPPEHCPTCGAKIQPLESSCPSAPTEENVTVLNEQEKNFILGALDTLGVALTAKGHAWTEGEWTIFNYAFHALGKEIQVEQFGPFYTPDPDDDIDPSAEDSTEPA
jgi:predicted nucleic acid-binding Zn ribbon protein